MRPHSVLVIPLVAIAIFSFVYVSVHVAAGFRKGKIFLDSNDPFEEEGDHTLSHSWNKPTAGKYTGGKRNQCTMATCVDVSKCLRGFKVYVYPSGAHDKVSPTYRTILNVIRNSSYFTHDPTQACIFVPNLDTLDRDPKSRNFMRRIGQKMRSLPHWNNGVNHLLFNLYSGKFPDYDADLFFDSGRAILAKASASVLTYRVGFDVSFPLLGPQHTELGKKFGELTDHGNLLPLKRKYLLVFKGKRYMVGYGSETRNNLSRIDNDRDILMLTTCRHMGNSWEDDARCESDNQRYLL